MIFVVRDIRHSYSQSPHSRDIVFNRKTILRELFAESCLLYEFAVEIKGQDRFGSNSAILVIIRNRSRSLTEIHDYLDIEILRVYAE
jgi:hypothetical protein